MILGIIGGGVVGRATARAFLEHVAEVRVWDVLPERRTHANEDVLKSDLVFVCLPEAAVEEFAQANAGREIGFVLKSTVPIGTTRRLAEQYQLRNLVHSPEFLTERCALTDAQLPARNIIGVPFPNEEPGELFSGGNRVARQLDTLYQRRFPGVTTYRMSSDESEAVKLITNAYFATKIAFFNEQYQLTQKLGLDWETVRAGILADGRIAHAHTQVPGWDGKLGFGGKCLEKDTRTLALQHYEANLSPLLLAVTLTRNQTDRARPV